MTNIRTSPLPPTRNIITSHQLPSSRAEPAVVVKEIYRQPAIPPSAKVECGITTLYTTDQTPATNEGDGLEPAAWSGPSVIPRGCHLKTVDLAPGAMAPFHRNISVDYNILMQGEVTLLTPSEESDTIPDRDDPMVQKTKLRAGDIVTQRGTSHAWWNESKTEWARWIAVILDAEPLPGMDTIHLTR